MLDDISLKILKILQEKARIPNVEIARRIEMAPSAVLVLSGCAGPRSRAGLEPR